MNLTKSQLKEIIKEELLKEQDSVADKDMKAAKKLELKLAKIYSMVNDNVKLIDRNISSFNAPGLRAAFLDGLRAGLKPVSAGGGFDARAAQKRFGDYFKR